MHTEQKVWSNWSLRQQNYLNYPTEYFVITWLRTFTVCMLSQIPLRYLVQSWFEAGRR